jgi:putative membrane protein
MRFGALALAAIALGACGQRDTAPSTESNEAATNEITASKAAASDRFEIEGSKLVASSAASAEVMAFARDMIAAHTASTAKLKAIVAKDPSLAVDDKLSPSQQATLEDMKMKKGYIFDAAYMAAQIHGHDETLTELKNYAASGDNVALKEFAQGLVPTVEQHLNEAKAINLK